MPEVAVVGELDVQLDPRGVSIEGCTDLVAEAGQVIPGQEQAIEDGGDIALLAAKCAVRNIPTPEPPGYSAG
jgi:hypothetical protein